MLFNVLRRVSAGKIRIKVLKRLRAAQALPQQGFVVHVGSGDAPEEFIAGPAEKEGIKAL